MSDNFIYNTIFTCTEFGNTHHPFLCELHLRAMSCNTIFPFAIICFDIFNQGMYGISENIYICLRSVEFVIRDKWQNIKSNNTLNFEVSLERMSKIFHCQVFANILLFYLCVVAIILSNVVLQHFGFWAISAVTCIEFATIWTKLHRILNRC